MYYSTVFVFLVELIDNFDLGHKRNVIDINLNTLVDNEKEDDFYEDQTTLRRVSNPLYINVSQMIFKTVSDIGYR